MAIMSGEGAPKQYQFKHAEYVPYLIGKEGDLEFQASQGKYDPETQEFIAWGDETSKGIIPTVGFGITPKSSSGFNVKIGQRVPLYVANMALDQEIDEKLKVVNRRIPIFNNLPAELRIPMLSSFYRGSLSGSPKTIKKINKGDFTGAAKEFLNNKEYRKSKKEGTGVAPRMEELANILRQYGEEIKKAGGGMVSRNPYPYNPRPI
jgi:GH24 family phage-related lysozyme (muramidase)